MTRPPSPQSIDLTVIVPVHNAAPWLEACLQSLLLQDYPGFQIIAVDDGSTDGSLQIIRNLSREHARIRYLTQDQAGASAARNMGLELARTPFIAMADADDLYASNRLSTQRSFLQAHPAVGVCGSAIRNMGAKSGIHGYPENDAQIKAEMLFNAPIAHPSVMMAVERLHGATFRYSTDYKVAHDYELWVRIAKRDVQFANLKSPLTQYRSHPAQLTSARNQECIRQENRALWMDQLSQMGLEVTPAHERISQWQTASGQSELSENLQWLELLAQRNGSNRIFPREAFLRLLTRRAYWACASSSAFGNIGWRGWKKECPSLAPQLSIVSRCKLMLRSFSNGS